MLERSSVGSSTWVPANRMEDPDSLDSSWFHSAWTVLAVKYLQNKPADGRSLSLPFKEMLIIFFNYYSNAD